MDSSSLQQDALGLPDLPLLVRTLIVAHIDSPATLSTLMHCSKDCLALCQDAHVRALWLATHRLQEAFKKAAESHEEAVFLQLMMLQQQQRASVNSSRSEELRWVCRAGLKPRQIWCGSGRAAEGPWYRAKPQRSG